MPSNFYVLTPTAKKNLREAKVWSLARWGSELTAECFQDLEKAAVYLAKNYKKLAKRRDLTGDRELGIYPIREHYMGYGSLRQRENRHCLDDQTGARHSRVTE